MFIAKNSNTTLWHKLNNLFCIEFMLQRKWSDTSQSVQWSGSGCIHCENMRYNFVARTYALIIPVPSILYRLSCSNEMPQNISFRSNRVDWCVRCEKVWCNFVAWAYAIMALVRLITARSNETVGNCDNPNN